MNASVAHSDHQEQSSQRSAVLFGFGAMIVLSMPSSGRARMSQTTRVGFAPNLFLPDALLILSGSDDGTLKLRAVKSARVVRTMDAQSRVTAVASAPDGRYAVSGSFRIALKLCKVASGPCPHVD